MKKYIYYLLNVILICIIIFNVYFLCKNIVMINRDTYYIENIQEDFLEMISKEINDKILPNIEHKNILY